MGEALIIGRSLQDPDSPKVKWISVAEVITENTTYKVPGNIRNSTLHVRCFGGGGAGYGGGGGGGNMNNADITLSEGSSIPITIGAGGDGYTTSSGGTTTFGSYVSASGGGSGKGSTHDIGSRGGSGGTGGATLALGSGTGDEGGRGYYGGGGGGVWLDIRYWNSFNTGSILSQGGAGGIYGGGGGGPFSFYGVNNITLNTLGCQLNRMYFNNLSNTVSGGNGVNLYSSTETYDNGVKIGGYGRPGNSNINTNLYGGASGGCGGYGGNGGNGIMYWSASSSYGRKAFCGGGGGGYGGNGGEAYGSGIWTASGTSSSGTTTWFAAGGGGGGYGGNGSSSISRNNNWCIAGPGGGGYGPQNYGAGGSGINGPSGMHGCVVISYQQLGFV